tara:strand:- start:1395 stop:2987 length:1593 start_codon:yes stop_codon:yes gene_type:complete
MIKKLFIFSLFIVLLVSSVSALETGDVIINPDEVQVQRTFFDNLFSVFSATTFTIIDTDEGAFQCDSSAFEWGRVIQSIPTLNGNNPPCDGDDCKQTFSNDYLYNCKDNACAVLIYPYDNNLGKYVWNKQINKVQGGETLPASGTFYWESYLCNNPTETCECTNYVSSGCGSSSCSDTEMLRTRTCTEKVPGGCDGSQWTEDFCSSKFDECNEGEVTPPPEEPPIDLCGDDICNNDETELTCAEDCKVNLPPTSIRLKISEVTVEPFAGTKFREGGNVVISANIKNIGEKTLEKSRVEVAVYPTKKGKELDLFGLSDIFTGPKFTEFAATCESGEEFVAAGGITNLETLEDKSFNLNVKVPSSDSTFSNRKSAVATDGKYSVVVTVTNGCRNELGEDIIVYAQDSSTKISIEAGGISPGGECKVPIGGACTPVNIPGVLDDSGPTAECGSGWCQDIRSLGLIDAGICSKVGVLAQGQKLAGAEPHPTCVALGTASKPFDLSSFTKVITDNPGISLLVLAGIVIFIFVGRR